MMYLTMKQISQNLLFFLFVFSVGSSCSAMDEHPSSFRVVVDSAKGNEKKPRLVPKKNIESSSFFVGLDHVDKRAMLRRAKKEFCAISAKTAHIREEAKEIVDKFKENLKHYSKRELGLYAALTVALTVTLKTVISSKASSKTIDLGKISYILASVAANSIVQNASPLVEFTNKSRRQDQALCLAVTPSIVSSDGKTYIRTIRKTLKKQPVDFVSSTSSPIEVLESQNALVVLDTVSTCHPEPIDAESLSASHNAVIKSMSPTMRRLLRAKRIRVRGGGTGMDGLMQRLEIGGYFLSWYALNVVYNIINKKVLNVLPAPLTIGSIQFGIGALYCFMIWVFKFRDCPTLTIAGKKAVTSVAACHMLGQLSTMVSLQAGPVSFSHIVKAVEPFFSAIVSGFYFKKWMKPQVYATLIPVVGGVGYACLKELNFSWIAFSGAMASNLFFALRAVLSKSALQSGEYTGTNLTAPNMFGLVTIAAFFLSIPVALIRESAGFHSLWLSAMDQVESKSHFVRAIFISGLFHYLNNEVMYMALGSVHPVTLAVGNTMKRVFILVASVVVFRNEISLQAGVGSGVGIAGVLLYSLTKQYYESLEILESKMNRKTTLKRTGKLLHQ